MPAKMEEQNHEQEEKEKKGAATCNYTSSFPQGKLPCRCRPKRELKAVFFLIKDRLEGSREGFDGGTGT